mmetsp:Transcript_20439/g.29985  ORF Transcript_20439/g.29985 Transcript_20439/m.29985 type:complete len:87 (+) Transcript_20439:108-368(+)
MCLTLSPWTSLSLNTCFPISMCVTLSIVSFFPSLSSPPSSVDYLLRVAVVKSILTIFFVFGVYVISLNWGISLHLALLLFHTHVSL